ncbi:unnamed protein product [Dovyalis caffra]|uniref:Uncharacterized protein n=1 Tax=Dovyalis caffra TaxID=77055 RepID=A0AAV1RM33_9ROSI|nr:unnamed protein product [Dovyalis caffra]
MVEVSGMMELIFGMVTRDSNFSADGAFDNRRARRCKGKRSGGFESLQVSMWGEVMFVAYGVLNGGNVWVYYCLEELW